LLISQPGAVDFISDADVTAKLKLFRDQGALDSV
jgi:hypothetical protein